MCIRFEKVGNMKDSFLYKILRPIIKGLFLIVFTPKIVGKENIPKDVRIVLAGKHISVFDALFLISAVDRDVHFLAKKELFDGPFGFIFSIINVLDSYNVSFNLKSSLSALGITQALDISVV